MCIVHIDGVLTVPIQFTNTAFFQGLQPPPFVSGEWAIAQFDVCFVFRHVLSSSGHLTVFIDP